MKNNTNKKQLKEEFDETKPVQLLVKLTPYERYQRVNDRTLHIKGKNLKAALITLIDKVQLYVDSSDIEEAEEDGEIVTGRDIIDWIDEQNGDGCDYIYLLKDENSGKVFIELDPYNDDEYYDESLKRKSLKESADEEEDEDEGMIYAVVNFKDDTSDEKYFKKIPEAINWCKKTYTQEGAESAQVYDENYDYGKLVWKWSEKDDIVFDESLKESVKIADIEIKDEDYVFDEDTGNIHLTDEVVNYHPKYKKYINVKFVDDEDEKIYTYKLVEYNPKETNYPYEFEYVSEAEDFVDMEESLKEDKDDADALVDTIDTELRYYGFYDPYYIKECKGDIEIMWDDYCNDNDGVNKEDTEIKIIFKELMQPHISNIQK